MDRGDPAATVTTIKSHIYDVKPCVKFFSSNYIEAASPLHDQFYKPDDKLSYKINIQKYKYNTRDQLSFYVNCSIHSNELAQLQSFQPPAGSMAVGSHFTARIRQIIPSAPERYFLTPDTDVDKFTAELLSDLLDNKYQAIWAEYGI